jgi:methylated-DNA-[protein]-cysteine S-methyltransferase
VKCQKPTYTYIDSPLGKIFLARNRDGLTTISFQKGIHRQKPKSSWQRDEKSLRGAKGQVEAYFAGQLAVFDLPLAPHGTPFENLVWEELKEIDYGYTSSYSAIARRLHPHSSARAVGAANRNNPLPIVIPCHRIIGADGDLKGYSGGREIKQALLIHEAKYRSRFTTASNPLI